MSGLDFNSGNPYTRAGVFTASGTGVITGGNDYFTEGGSSVPAVGLSGTYAISNDGTGSVVLTIAGASVQWVFTLQSGSNVYMAETNSNPSGGFTGLTGYGFAELQTSVAQPSGTYVFRNHTSIIGSSITPIGSVGAMTIASGVVTGTEDVNALGTGLIPSSISSGAFNPPDVTGTGSGTFTDNNGTTIFQYFVVDSSHVVLLITTPGSIGLGRAELQSAGPFTLTSLNGSYAFGSQGDTSLNLNAIHTVGRFTSDGNGGISAGALDAVTDGTITTNGAYTGTYTMASNGRAVLSLSTTGQPVYWMISPSRAFFLGTSTSNVAEGSVDLQTVSSFSNSTVSGQFAFVNDGITLTGTAFNTSLDRVATLQWSGAGGLTLNEFINVSGTTSTPGFLTGNYSVASNGRATGKINGSTNNINLVFYLVSGGQAYVLQTDPNTEVGGITQLQQ